MHQKHQVSSLVYATGKGATGSARGWACPAENFAGEIPQPHVSTQRVDQTTDKQTIKKASKHITVSTDSICYAIRRSSCLTTRG